MKTLLRSLTSILLLLSSAPAFARQAEQEPAEQDAVEQRGLLLRTEKATPGYTLIGPLSSRNVYLVDLDGNVVHTWETDLPPGGGLYLLDNGNLLRCSRVDDNPRFHGGGIGGIVQEIAWDGSVVWQYDLHGDDMTQHHDVEPLPGGNVLLIAWEYQSPAEAEARGRSADAIGEEGLWPDVILEIEPTLPEGGEVVWEWRAWDHLIQDQAPDAPEFGSVPDHPERIDINVDHRDRPPLSAAERERLEQLEEQMAELGYVGGPSKKLSREERREQARRKQRPDWLHTNGVDYHPEYDLIVLSPPQLNEVWVIDHSTTTPEAASSAGGTYGRGGDLLYRWGNPRNHGAGDDDDRRLFYQHNPTWVPASRPGELRLLIYNNGGGRPQGDYSSVIELLLPFDPEQGFLRQPGQAFGPAEPAWVYEDREEFFSGFISGAQRLANGNTLICEGASGRVFEVTPDGEVVWSYLNPLGGDITDSGPGGNAPKHALFRATRISPHHPGLSGRGL